jgi:signal peptidase I
MGAWLKGVAVLALVLGGIFGLLQAFVFELWTVPTDDPLLAVSIAPTLAAGDVVLVMRHSSVARGSLLRCADPDAPGRFVVARAIGHGGERIELRDEVVVVDSDRKPNLRACDPPTLTLHDPRVDADVLLSCGVEDFGDVAFSVLHATKQPEKLSAAEVEPQRWFLVSDNRHIHLDSRDYGQIDPNTCQHLFFRVVGAEGFGDTKARLSIIW